MAMPKLWEVFADVNGMTDVRVEAETEEEAIEKAKHEIRMDFSSCEFIHIEAEEVTGE